MNLLKLLLLIAPIYIGSCPVRDNTECVVNLDNHFSENYHDVGLDSSCILTRSTVAEEYGPEPFSVEDIDDDVNVTARFYPPNLGVLLGITEVGCFADNQEGTFDFYNSPASTTIEMCTAWARENNYQYIGLQSGGGCAGSNNVTKITAETSDNCNIPCVLDPLNNCGGWLANRVFMLGPNNIKQLIDLFIGDSTTIDRPYYLFGITGQETVKDGPASSTNLYVYHNVSLKESPVFDGIFERKNHAKYPNSHFRVLNSTFPQSYTKSVWLYYDMPMPGNDFPNILSSGGPLTSNTSHYMLVKDKKVSAGHHTGFNQSQIFVQDPIKIPFKIWTHYVVTYNHSTMLMKLYKNGVVVSSALATYPDWEGDQNEFLIGAYRGLYSFTGYLAQVSVYNFSLNLLQVQALYEQIRNIPLPPPPDVEPPRQQQLLGNGINYRQGGPVMLGVPNVYYLWYGNFANSGNMMEIVNRFTASLGGTPWYNIQTTYFQNVSGKVDFISNAFRYGGSAADPSYSYNKTLPDSAIYYLIRNAITTNQLPLDDNGVYLVLTSKDVTLSSGFCTQYCGWHTLANMFGKRIKYGFIGDASEKCSRSCMPQSNVSPNNNPAADAMLSIIAHEIVEAIGDPDVSTWLDNARFENADKCAWTWSTTYNTPNGARANLNIGGYNYMIQQNYVNDRGGYCAIKYP